MSPSVFESEEDYVPLWFEGFENELDYVESIL